MLVLFSVGIVNYSNAQEDSMLPDWVRNIFVWYADNEISENELLKAVEYLADEGIISVNSGYTCGTGTEAVDSICQVTADVVSCPDGTSLVNGLCKVDLGKPLPCLKEGLPKPITQIISPVDGTEISGNSVNVQIRVQANESGPDSIWVYLNDRIVVKEGNSCNYPVTVNYLKQGENVIKARSWDHDGVKGDFDNITVYVR